MLLRILELRDVEEIKRIRERTGLGLLDARKILWKERAEAAVDNAKTVQDLKDLLKDIIQYV